MKTVSQGEIKNPHPKQGNKESYVNDDVEKSVQHKDQEAPEEDTYFFEIKFVD